MSTGAFTLADIEQSPKKKGQFSASDIETATTKAEEPLSGPEGMSPSEFITYPKAEAEIEKKVLPPVLAAAATGPLAAPVSAAVGGGLAGAAAGGAVASGAFVPVEKALSGENPVSKESLKQAGEAAIAGGLTAGTVGALAKGASLFPSLTRAGQAFQEVSAVAGRHTVPVTNGLSEALSNYQKLVDAGGSRSLAVSKLLNRLTDPSKPPMTYDEARLFYSNISRLSADESQRLTPVMKRAVGQIAGAFNSSIADTAEAAGQLDKFQGAMSEYRKAMTARDVAQQAKEIATKAAVSGAIGAGGYYGFRKLMEAAQ